MICMLLVADTPDALQKLAGLLEAEGIAIQWAHDGRTALESVVRYDPDLVILNETIAGAGGLEWVRRIMTVNAFVQTAVVSRLSPEAFHEASEGLGILQPLPPRPNKSIARQLVTALGRSPGIDQTEEDAAARADR